MTYRHHGLTIEGPSADGYWTFSVYAEGPSYLDMDEVMALAAQLQAQALAYSFEAGKAAGMREAAGNG